MGDCNVAFTLLLHKSWMPPHLSFLSPCCGSQNLHHHGERIQERGKCSFKVRMQLRRKFAFSVMSIRLFHASELIFMQHRGLGCRRGGNNTALVQRLGCSVNAAFRTGLAQYLGCSVNAGFRARVGTVNDRNNYTDARS